MEDHLALPRHQAVEVWAGGRSVRMQGLLVTADSVTGVAFPQPSGCTDCTVSVARTEVDSVRVGDPVGAFSQTALIAGVVAFTVACVLTNACGWWTGY